MEKETFEKLSDLEHQQWMKWSRSLGKTLEAIKLNIKEGRNDVALTLIDNKLDSWKKNWISYNKLDENTKDYDRYWTKKLVKIIEGESNENKTTNN